MTLPGSSDVELEALRRVDRAARAYVSGELSAVAQEESHKRWEILVDALDQVPGDGEDRMTASRVKATSHGHSDGSRESGRRFRPRVDAQHRKGPGLRIAAALGAARVPR